MGRKVKVGIVALSVDESILRSHYLDTYEYFLAANINPFGIVVEGLVYTQGYEIKNSQLYTGVKIVRDDSMFRKGYVISEIRDYFTKRAFEENEYDYILSCDDDFKFRPRSHESILNDVLYMERYRNVGVTCMHYHKGGPDDSVLQDIVLPTYYYDFNPSRVATRSGIMIRKEAFVSWGGEDKVRYFEEAVMATYAYQEGFRVVHSLSDTIHKTKSTGLGQSLERKYGKNDIPQSGRQILHQKGLLDPSLDKEGNPRYDTPCKVSSKLLKDHLDNHRRRFNMGEESYLMLVEGV